MPNKKWSANNSSNVSFRSPAPAVFLKRLDFLKSELYAAENAPGPANAQLVERLKADCIEAETAYLLSKELKR